MRNEANRYQGSNFATEKVVATIYAIMFVVILGMSVQAQLDRIKPGQPQPISFAATD